MGAYHRGEKITIEQAKACVKADDMNEFMKRITDKTDLYKIEAGDIGKMSGGGVTAIRTIDRETGQVADWVLSSFRC